MSETLADLMSEDAASAASSLAEVHEAGVSRLSELAEDLDKKTSYMKDLEQKLKDVKIEILQITDNDVPSLMQEMGVRSFTLENGAKIDIKPTYGGHISAANKDDAFEWLRENDFDDIIKNDITVSFGKGEDAEASKAYDLLNSSGFQPSDKQSVHAQTLKAWVRERVEKGEEFPMILFGAHIGQRASIKSGKKG